MNNNWILIKDELPENGVLVIVTDKNGYVFSSLMSNGKWLCMGIPIAWMYLPEPYDEDN